MEYTPKHYSFSSDFYREGYRSLCGVVVVGESSGEGELPGGPRPGGPLPRGGPLPGPFSTSPSLSIALSTSASF